MKHFLLFSLFIVWGMLSAQDFQEVSTGTGYNQQSFINIQDGTQKQNPNNAWDIAFAVAQQDAGVFINESVGSATGAAPIQLFYTLSEDFSAVPDSANFNDFPLLNTERSWSYGAFNEIRAETDPVDFGWGVFSPQTQAISGNHVFVVELRDGNFLKVQIQSLQSGSYTFRYANLDGTGEVTRTINKADHAGKVLAYFSFTSGEVVDIEPSAGFDLLFCRYIALLENPQGGGPIPYLVTGILSGYGVQVAQADGVDPATVLFESFEDSLSADLEIIGHDWKTFDLGSFQWLIPQNLVYFVKTADDRVWKIQFVYFEGSSTGNMVFQKTDLGIISAIHDPQSELESFNVFPNPASSLLDVVYSVKENVSDHAELYLIDGMGRIVLHRTIQTHTGLNATTLSVDALQSQIYTLRVDIGHASIAERISIVD